MYDQQQQDFAGLLLRLYQASQGLHKASKKAQEELQTHLATCTLPVDCHQKLFHQVLHHATLSGDANTGPTRWLALIAASNLLSTAELIAYYGQPPQQCIIFGVLRDAIERWFKLCSSDDRPSSQLRDGVFVPSTVLQHERLAQQSGRAFALGMFIDAIVGAIEAAGDDETVAVLARVLQATLHQPKALQKVFVRVANVLMAWITRAETAPAQRDIIVAVLFDMKELWATNTVFASQVTTTLARELDELSGSLLHAGGLLRLNGVVVSLMAVIHGLGHGPAAHVVHALLTCGSHYLLHIKSVLACATALTKLAADATDDWALAAVDFLLLHTCALSERHLASTNHVATVLDAVDVLLGALQPGRHAIAALRVLSRRLPVELPMPYGVKTVAPTPKAPRAPTALRHLVHLPSLLPRVTRLAVALTRVGGLATLEVFGFDAVSSTRDLPYTMFCLMVLGVAEVPSDTGDGGTLGGICARLAKALDKWAPVPAIFTSAVAVLGRLLPLAGLVGDAGLVLATTLARHVGAFPTPAVFRLFQYLMDHAPTLAISLPLDTELLPPFQGLTRHADPTVRGAALRCLTAFVAAPLLDVGLELLFDGDADVAAQALHVVGHAALTHRATSKAHVTPKASRSPQPPPTAFTAGDFAALMAALEANDPTLWSSTSASATPLLDARTRVWTAAAWCVDQRLRTHYGNAGQTFAALERLLHQHKALTGPSARLVLEFVHALELAILHACNEAATDADNKTTAFYKTNRRVCEDWLLRIRPALIRISDRVAAAGLSRYHALALVRGARKPAPTPGGFFAVATALCDGLDVPALQGYVAWSQRLKLHLPWLPAMLEEAQLLYEAAAATYEKLFAPLHALATNLGTGLQLEHEAEAEKVQAVGDVTSYVAAHGLEGVDLSALFIRCAHCYANVRDWPGVAALMATALDVAAFLGHVQACTATPLSVATDMAALAVAWDVEKQLVDAKVTPSLRFSRLPTTLPPLQQWTVLGVVDDALLRCSLAPALTDVQLDQHAALLAAQLRLATLDETSIAVVKGQRMSRRLERMLLEVACLDMLRSPRLPASRLRLRAHEHDSSVYLPLLDVSRYLGLDQFDLQLAMVRLARKQGNTDFAQTLLAQVADGPATAAVVTYERACLLYAGSQPAAAFASMHPLAMIAERSPVLGKVHRKLAQWLLDDASWSAEEKTQCLAGASLSATVEASLAAATVLEPLSYQAWLAWSNYWFAACAAPTDNTVTLTRDETTAIDAALASAPALPADALRTALRRFIQNDSEADDTVSFAAVCDPLPASPALDALHDVYNRVRARVLEPHRAAIRGYLTYLATASPASMQSHGLIVTLRLLGFIVQWGHEPSLQPELDAGLASAPIQPWERVVPQLLARLGHPHPAVSMRVTAILARLAAQSPQLMVYPVVVESLAGSLVAPDVVASVAQVVTELRRVAHLWEDAWIGLLTKLGTDVARRGHTLEKEAQRVNTNTSLSPVEKRRLGHVKFVAIMKPVVAAIEALRAETFARNPETPHERWFAVHFAPAIDAALIRFHDACAVGESLRASLGGTATADPLVEYVWMPLHDVLKRLTPHQRRLALPLAEISPVLAGLDSGQVPMPGVGATKKGALFVDRIEPVAHVLATKTRPKTLTFYGSDGRPHQYLLKAKEDLHLDERIMQLLATINVSLGANKDARTMDLVARHYSVVPLSNDSGLIQMVPDVMPLFQLYTQATQAVASPTAPFYAQLKALGIKDATPGGRPTWPLSVLRQAYITLVAEGQARPNVLRQALLATSSSVDAYERKNTRFARSLAVMSVVGYLIGLGDRHLDNILLCATGDVVHIDYNVCFDKGRKLKVPEVVPFRLTSMLLGALGPTGVDGTFRVAMERTLAVARDDVATKETILTLLQAFVYDPLVDWKEGPRKLWRMEMNVQLSLFASRAHEREVETHDVWANILASWGALRDGCQRLVAVAAPVVGAAQRAAAAQKELRALQAMHDAAMTELQTLQLAQIAVAPTPTTTDHDAVRVRVEALARDCSERRAQLQAWLATPPPELEWGLEDLPPFTGVCADAPLLGPCTAVDRAAFYLAEALTELGTELQPALAWFQQARQSLYSPARGPSAFDEWCHWTTAALHDATAVDAAAAVRARADETARLAANLIDLDNAVTESKLPEPPTVPDTMTAVRAVRRMGDAVHRLKSDWQLSNAQGHKALKLAIAQWCLDEQAADRSWPHLSALVVGTAWLMEVAGKGSFRHVPIEPWLTAPLCLPVWKTGDKWSALHGAVAALHAFDVRVLPQFCHPLQPLRRCATSALCRRLRGSLEALQCTSLPHTAWLEALEWAVDAIPAADDLPLTAYFAPTLLWAAPGLADLRHLCHRLCTIECAGSDAHEAIEAKWATCLLDIGLLVCDGANGSALRERFHDAASELLAQSYAAHATLVQRTCSVEWKLKAALTAEWAQFVHVPSSTALLNQLQLPALLAQLTEAWRAALAHEAASARCASASHAAGLAQQQRLLAAWLADVPASGTMSRTTFLTLLDSTRPAVAEMLERRQTLQAVLTDVLPQLEVAVGRGPKPSAQLQAALTAASALLGRADAVADSLMWIHAAEAAYRDSGSDAVAALDAGGIHLLDEYRALLAASSAQDTVEQRRRVRAAALATEVHNAQERLVALHSVVNTAHAELDRHLPRVLPFLGPVLEPLQTTLVPEAFAALHEAAPHALWENERLVRLLAKSLRPGALPDFQAKLRAFDDVCRELRTIVGALQAPVLHLAGVPLDSALGRKKTLAAVVSGGGSSSPSQDAGRQLVTDIGRVLEALAWTSPEANAVATAMALTSAAMEAFEDIANTALELSKEEEGDWSDDDDSSSDNEESNDTSDDRISDDATDAVRVQERNRYGLQVLQRVKEKLDGFPTPRAPPLKVPAHVDWLVSQATSVDNLCVMYEGWTPWI
ncbi:phosphatidylinositol kinase [Achlya hypogyna]|uniref:non-specific serine/threonine protein kinase n=1 Tax=Achlya hypogyna TaxID=1202772 RepID=A0A1V9ZA08_ACHHY|nr:phosphatidylinositol kinase [Achlya hypogyna]